MGEAKKKAAALAGWQDKLSPEERIVSAVSQAAYDKIVRRLGAIGVCYRISFFLTEFLLQEHGIRIEPIVGYVNDGESEVMASHAWVEFGGKKIDLSLTLTERPHVQPPGPLVILDRQFKFGRAAYTYHRERSPAALRRVEELMRVPAYNEVVLHKEAEHRQMEAIARSPTLIRVYLDAAPDGLGYEELARRIRSTYL
jgi:hypothetical protein